MSQLILAVLLAAIAFLGGVATGKTRARPYRNLLMLGCALATGMAALSCGAPTPVGPTPVAATPAVVTGSGASEASLTIESFSVIEYYAGGRWNYAPLVRVAETGGRSSADVTALSFSIPGLGPAPGMLTRKCVEAGQERDLLHEVYGDYEETIDQAGVRASAGEATATVTFRDQSGRIGTATASGPVTPGGLPTTYSNSAITWFCASR